MYYLHLELQRQNVFLHLSLVWLLLTISGMRAHLSDHKTSREEASIVNSIQPKMRNEMSDKSDRVRGERCHGCERALCFISGGII